MVLSMAWELSLPVIIDSEFPLKSKEAVAATWILGALLSIVVMLLGFLGFVSSLAIPRYSCRNSSPVLSIYFYDCDLCRCQLCL